MDTVGTDNQNESPKVILIQGEAGGPIPESLARKPIELAIAIRRHAKLGKARKEICALEGCTDRQFRYAVQLLGQAPEKNEEAYGLYKMAMQARLEDIEGDIITARTNGDLRALAGLQRTAVMISDAIMEMGMKLGILVKAAEKVEISEQRYQVGFGDEFTKANWPPLGTTVKQ